MREGLQRVQEEIHKKTKNVRKNGLLLNEGEEERKIKEKEEEED